MEVPKLLDKLKPQKENLKLRHQARYNECWIGPFAVSLPRQSLLFGTRFVQGLSSDVAVPAAGAGRAYL